MTAFFHAIGHYLRQTVKQRLDAAGPHSDRRQSRNGLWRESVTMVQPENPAVPFFLSVQTFVDSIQQQIPLDFARRTVVDHRRSSVRIVQRQCRGMFRAKTVRRHGRRDHSQISVQRVGILAAKVPQCAKIVRAEPGECVLNQIVGDRAIAASPPADGSENRRGDHGLCQANERLPAAGGAGFQAAAKDLRDISGLEWGVDYKSIRLRSGGVHANNSIY
jgi:hypothetical protein